MKKLNFTYYIILYFCVCVCVYGQEESNSIEDLAPSEDMPTEGIHTENKKQDSSSESSYQPKEVPEKTKQVSENLKADIKKYNQDYQILSSYFLNFENTIEKTYNETKVQENILERKNEKINQENNKILSLLNSKNVNTSLNLYQVEMLGAEEEKVLSKVGRQKLKAYFNKIKKESKSNQSTNPFAAIFVKELMFKKGEIDFDNIFVRLISALILVACDNCFTYTGKYELEFKLHAPETCNHNEYESENFSSENSVSENYNETIVDKVDNTPTVLDKKGVNTKDSNNTPSVLDKNGVNTKNKSLSITKLKYDTKGCIISKLKNKTKVNEIKIVKIVKSEDEAGKYKKGELLPFKGKITSIYRADDGKATIYTK